MSSSKKILDQLEKNILEIKNALYKDVIIYDADHTPQDLEPLANYKAYLIKILQYWSRLIYDGKEAASIPIMMPTHELQKMFTEQTSWFIRNIVNSKDADLRTSAIYSVKRNCERDPLYLA